ncbi:transcriptional regulator family: Fungal Specific TF [Paecilomyces variotii]|nr:transcriptional regulator family: Fungal Specific TF [Paecilomyces variotii]
MVGVAGKSKACNTCRKRKVACDLQRPQCSQCVKSNRVCTGYQRKRIFIFHQGTHETHHETSRNGPGISTTPDSRSTTSPYQESNITFFSTHTRGRKPSPRTRNQISTLESNRSLLHVTYRKQLFNAYLRSHIPPSQLQSLGTPWLALIPELASPTEALETSTLALATSKLGRLNNDPILTRESLRLYTSALRQLQKALWDPGLMYRDETLAACMALAMYEMMECPSGDKSGVHATLQDMHRHSPSYISSSTWTSIPWTNIPKTEFDQFFDLFVRGPATFQAVDRLDTAGPLEKLRIALSIVHSCWELDSDLTMFYEQFEKSSLGPLYWPEFAKPLTHRKKGQNDNGYDYADDDDDDDAWNNISLFPISLHFPNLGTARTIILYWATLTMLWSGLYQLYGLIYALKETILDPNSNSEHEREDHNTNTPPPPTPSATKFDSNTNDTDAENLTFQITHLPPLDDHRRDFASMARNVCQSVEYCMQEEMLGLGPIILPAPLGIVIDTMKGYESFAKEVRWARRVMRRISEGGLRILE